MAKNEHTGGALLRAWRTGDNITPKEATRRRVLCRNAGKPETLELSQIEAAAFLGVSQSALSSWETDEKTPRIPIAAQIDARTGGRCPLASWAPAPAAEVA